MCQWPECLYLQYMDVSFTRIWVFPIKMLLFSENCPQHLNVPLDNTFQEQKKDNIQHVFHKVHI